MSVVSVGVPLNKGLYNGVGYAHSKPITSVYAKTNKWYKLVLTLVNFKVPTLHADASR